MTQSKHDQMLALAKMLRADTKGRLARMGLTADAADALTDLLEENAALLDKGERLRENIQALCENNLTLLHKHTKVSEENATLRTEKHADAEAIGALREALKDAEVEIEHLNQFMMDTLKGDTP